MNIVGTLSLAPSMNIGGVPLPPLPSFSAILIDPYAYSCHGETHLFQCNLTFSHVDFFWL